jgi:hypothetical protein
MSEQLVKKALKHHASLWQLYRQTAPPNAVHPLAFRVRARTEADAQRIAATLASAKCTVIETARSWWPPLRRWRVVATTAPMPFTERDTERWVRSIATMVGSADGYLDHWHPYSEAGA